MQVKLIAAEFDLIKSERFMEKIDSISQKMSKKGEKYYISLSPHIANEVREWALEKLQQIGFDINYNLTTEGKLLESLIDKFYN